MYIPKAFSITDINEQISFIKSNAFGNFLSFQNSKILSVFLPFIVKDIEGKLYLEGHLAKNNPFSICIIEKLKGNCHVLGSHGYVSSSVYTHVNVPTYNYQVAEIEGVFSELNPEEFQLHLIEVVNSFEKDRAEKLDFNNWPIEMIEAYKKEIIGFRFEIQTIQCAFKLSQNRNEIDFQNIINDLEKSSLKAQQLAFEMKKNRK